MLDKIRGFRYKAKYYSDDNAEVGKSSGFVFGKSYGDAVERVNNIFTKPDGISEIIGIYIEEIDCYSVAVLEDDIIKEFFEEED